jgi:hypothetical protein
MQVALGAVGAVIGGYFGGPAGASLGWSLGSVVGSVAFPPDGPHLEGPRLTDLHGTISTYGATIPRFYGEVGVAGNIIWMDPIRETSTTTEQSAKGGPTATSTSYSYSALSPSLRLEPSEYVASHPYLIRQVLLRCPRRRTSGVVASQNFAEFFTFYDGNVRRSPTQR